MIGHVSEKYPYKNFSEAIDLLDRQTDEAAAQWLGQKRSASAAAALGQLVRTFCRVYFKEGSRRQGVPGLFWAVHCAMIPFLTYAKYWELKRDQR